ncbi:MAG TPA: glycosyltransferase family 1 protein [Bacteroidota bacterium]|nr:glycosyltransferase family 1 protein [Bacteroidota bacterium]
MARIGIDARKYFDFGIGTYIRQLTCALHDGLPKHYFVLFVSQDDNGRIPSSERMEKVVANVGKYTLREWLFYAGTVRRERVDLFHEPHYTLPAGLSGKSVVTIHDLIHLKFPEYFSAGARAYAWFMMRHAVKNSGAVIAVSERTKQDIVEQFDVREEKVHVVYNGIGKHFRRLEPSEALQQFKKRYALEKPFVLYVGGLGRHKNIPVLLRAFRILLEKEKGLQLVFAGKRLFEVRELAQEAQRLGIEQCIKDLGMLQDDELVELYNLASVVVLPSLYEGFGFPALEAMACETPVVVSDRGSLPEIVGDAALIVEAENDEAFASSLESVLVDSEVRKKLIERGRSRVAGFTWEEAARKTAQVYEKLLNRT